MDRERETSSVAARNGEWGENVATEFLRRGGFEIIDRNSRPVRNDQRLEIDIVAWDKSTDTMVFVEVKMHSDMSPYQRRLRSIDRKKRENLRRACNVWRRINRWRGSYRFDVIEIYGVPGKGKPIIDHIERVSLFVRKERYVKWV